MMNSISKALYRFWSGFGVPAYEEGRVPVRETRGGVLEPVDPPYITYDVRYGEIFATIPMVAINWHSATNGSSGSAERFALMGKIAAAIPVEGVGIDLDNGGYLVLHRGPEFQADYNDPDDPSVIGGRTSYTIIYYTL